VNGCFLVVSLGIMNEPISPFYAYAATYEFLGQYYDAVHNDMLGALLESMRLKRETRLPVNPAMRMEWLALVPVNVTAEEGYALMGEFLRKLSLKIEIDGLQDVIAYISLNEHNPEVQKIWEESLEAAKSYKEWDT
jgi:hypothetical protein